MSSVETHAAGQSSSLHPIAALYQRFVMDPLVEVAHAISLDFIKRPQYYRGISEDVANNLDDFRLRTGSDPKWPNAAERANLFAGWKIIIRRRHELLPKVARSILWRAQRSLSL